MTNPKSARSLYDCSHPLVYGIRVVCDKGHRLDQQGADGSLNVRLVDRGDPLVFTVCQNCTDYSPMGEPFPYPDELKGHLPRKLETKASPLHKQYSPSQLLRKGLDKL